MKKQTQKQTALQARRTDLAKAERLYEQLNARNNALNAGKPLLNQRESAELLGISTDTFVRMQQDGRLGIGKKSRYTVWDLAAGVSA